jgi:Glycosyl hydrolase family 99
MPSKRVKTNVVERSIYYLKFIVALICMCLLLSACQIAPGPVVQSSGHATPTPSVGASPTHSQSPQQGITPTSTPTPASNPASSINPNRPVLAFYYMWYAPTDWCSCHMSDLPTIQYTSSDDTTIARQVSWAANAGITGFISSWWGPGDKTDSNFAKLLAHSATLESSTGYHFASAVYIENNAHALQGTMNMINALQYVIAHYVNDPHYFHWHGKPVIFFASPIVGNGRTLATWTSIRSQVDPHNQMIWSAEGTDINLLSVFDGIHLFSAGYWGILHGDMAAVDQGFRSKIDAYNSAHKTQKIWAAGVLPGYDDTRVPGRTGTYIVPRNNGATYRTSWMAAMASNPDWITITTFNEWFEGAMIEPSVHYGNLYLDLTAQYAKMWHG